MLAGRVWRAESAWIDGGRRTRTETGELSALSAERWRIESLAPHPQRVAVAVAVAVACSAFLRRSPPFSAVLRSPTRGTFVARYALGATERPTWLRRKAENCGRGSGPARHHPKIFLLFACPGARSSAGQRTGWRLVRRFPPSSASPRQSKPVRRDALDPRTTDQLTRARIPINSRGYGISAQCAVVVRARDAGG
jgi:hypothetical protein